MVLKTKMETLKYKGIVRMKKEERMLIVRGLDCDEGMHFELYCVLLHCMYVL